MSLYSRAFFIVLGLIILLKLGTIPIKTDHGRRRAHFKTNDTNDTKQDLDLGPAGSVETFGILYTLNDGHKIPAIALGTRFDKLYNENGTLLRYDENIMAKAVEVALKNGVGHIETAASYKTEKMVGLGVRNYLYHSLAGRDEVFITTQLPNDAHERHQVIPTLKESLARLQMDYVDLFLIEYPMAITKFGYFNTTDYLETWKGMEDAKDANLTKSIGVSNFNITQMNRLWNNSRIKPAVLQIDVNPTFSQKELINWCEERGVVVMASNPLGIVFSVLPEPQPIHEVFQSLLQKYRKTVPQILLRYLLDRKLVPVPRFTQPYFIQSISDVFDFKLTATEVAMLSSFNNDLRIRPLFNWYSHPHFPFEKHNVTEKQINDTLEEEMIKTFASL